MQILKHKRIKLKPAAYKRLQLAVLERDNFTCQNCGCYTENAPHHIIFRSHLGDDSLENLVLLCPVCHAKAHGINVK